MLSREEIRELRKIAEAAEGTLKLLSPSTPPRTRAALTYLLCALAPLCDMALAGLDATPAGVRSLADLALWLESNPASTSVTIPRSLAESLIRPVAVERKTGGM